MYDLGVVPGIPWGINPYHPVNTGLRGWWTTTVPHITGGSTWYDLSDRDPGTLVAMGAGLGWQSSGSWRWPTSLKFDGSASIVTLPSPAGIISTRVFTMAAWIKTSSAVANSTFYGEGNSSTTQSLAQLAMDQTSGITACFAIRDDGNHSVVVTGTVAINDGSWHHVVYTSDGTTLSIYVDGKFDNSGSIATITTITLNTVSLGCLTRPATSNFWAGQLADLRNYPITLSGTQVAALFRESELGYPGALLYWRPMSVAFAPVGDPVFPFPISMSVP